MRCGPSRRLLRLAAAGLGLLPALAAAGVEDARPPTAESILTQAFARRYDADVSSEIELVMRNRAGQERRRRFQAMSKLIDDRMHSLGRLVWPSHLRGMTILTIETDERGHDAFVYLPSLDKVRRITTAQKGDSFLGSDITYEDLERRRSEDFELGPLESDSLDGEPVWVIRAQSRRPLNYAYAVFWVAHSDLAILRTEYFRRGQSEPFRVLDAPRASIVRLDGHVLPTRLVVHNHVRGTITEVTFEGLKLDPGIDPRLFSETTLQQERPLPSF